MTFRGATMEFHIGCGGVAMSPLAACHGTPRGVPLIVLPRNGIPWGCTTMTMSRKIEKRRTLVAEGRGSVRRTTDLRALSFC